MEEIFENPNIRNDPVSIEIDDDDDTLSGKGSSISPDEKIKFNSSTTSFRLFERLSDSFSRKKSEKVKHSDCENVTNEIHVISSSSDNKFIASWCKKDGLLAVWPIEKNRKKLHPIFATITPFNESNSSDSRLYLSVSEEGDYVAISRIKIIQETSESPNMETNTINSKKLKENVKFSFVVYSTFVNSINRDDIKLNKYEITSPLFFIKGSRLAFFTDNEMHIYSTKSWKMIRAIALEALVPIRMDEADIPPDFYFAVFSNMLMNSLKYGHLLIPEQHDSHNGISLWDLDGTLKQWFNVNSGNEYIFDVCIISEDGDLIARLISESDTIVVYHTYTGLMIKEFTVPKNTFYIAFRPNTYQIIEKDDQLLFVDDNFIQINNNELELLPFFPPNISKLRVEPLFKKSEESNPSKTLLLNIIIDEDSQRSICWCRILNNENKELCRFKFEPWRYYETCEIFLKWLDDNRFLIVGVDSAQIYSLKTKDNHAEKILIPSNKEHNCNNVRLLLDACASLSFLRSQYERSSDISHFNRVTISKQVKRLIEKSLTKYPSAFTKIYMYGQHIFPVRDFILIGWDDIVEKVLKEDQYIPLFHEDDKTESALSLLVKLQKSELLNTMVSYIIKHVHQRQATNFSLRQPGFALTLGNTILELYKYCPDIGIMALKEISYLTISSETNTRILETELKKDERTSHHQLKAVGVNSQLTKSFDLYKKKKAFWNFIKKSTIKENFLDSFSSASNKNLTFYETNQGNQIGRKIDGKTIKKQPLSNTLKTHPAKLCVVPLPNLCVYPTINDDLSWFERFWELYIRTSHLSSFAKIAFDGPPEMFDQVAMEAIVKYKWEKFARTRFMMSFLFYLVYATIFCITISNNNDMVPGSSHDIRFYFFLLISIMAILSLLQEFRQIIGYQKDYFFNLSNYVDLISYIFPLITSIMVIVIEVEPPEWLKSYSILMVWLNVSLYSRAFSGPGKFIVIVVQIVKRIYLMIITLAFIVASFANALFVLLRDDQVMERLKKENEGIENEWTTYLSSLFATWKFLGIGFLTVIVLLNVLIGFITEVFSGNLQVEHQIWLRQRAEIIAEIEIFLLLPFERQRSDWFPRLIYYECHLDQIKQWKTQLSQEELNVEFIKGELKIINDNLNEKLIILNEKIDRLNKIEIYD
ncbi:11901_t:CDS:2 [Diversispora eburnea]|uniref:11901_t:CDS:1 n=1 Tax=Diversispora eburnea TaxID=1213867 RepID=A0A9N9A7D9_9GLOM|nr:11901_t:CDS:2 [Diversispora eburnea]